MTQRDIKRLERAASIYTKIANLLDKTYDSIESRTTEYITTPGRDHTRLSTTSIVKDALTDALSNQRYLRGKIELIKEQLT